MSALFIIVLSIFLLCFIVKRQPETFKKNNQKELVIARCNEDIGWVKKYAKAYDLITIYNKCEKEIDYDISPNIIVKQCPNIGSCDYAFLSYIIDRYDTLPEFVEFTKGWRPPRNEFYKCPACPHDQNKFNQTMDFSLSSWSFQNKKNSSPNLSFARSGYQSFGDWIDAQAFISKDLYRGNKCNLECTTGQFGTTRKQIKNTPKEIWEDLQLQQQNANAEVDHFIERTWKPLLCRK